MVRKQKPFDFEAMTEVNNRQMLLRKLNAQNFGKVVVVLALLGLQNTVFSFYWALGARKKVFNEEWSKEKL